MPRDGGLGYIAVLLVALAIVVTSVGKHSYFTPDGVVYARYAARDAGMTERAATLSTRAFYERTPLMNVPRYRALVELDPSVAFERSRIFLNRPLYPAVVSVLMPRYGFNALFIVSKAAYVGFALALYWLLAAFGSRYVAFGLTALAIAAPVTRIAGASDLTDMLALLLWTAWLAALMHSLGARSRGYSALLVALCVSAALLVLTRPSIYLIVVPAVVAAICAGARTQLLVSASALIVFAAIAFGQRTYGVTEQLRWMYQNVPGANAQPFDVWYRTALAQTVRASASGFVRAIAPVVAVICAAYAAFGRQRREVYVLLAAFVACLLPIVINPVPDQLGRVVGLPMLPVLCGMIHLAIQRHLDERVALREAGTRAT